jgi:hypothetical protein
MVGRLRDRSSSSSRELDLANAELLEKLEPVEPSRH